MNLLLFAPDPQGHMLGLHTRHIARAALARGWRLHLATTQRAVDHPVFGPLREEFCDRLPFSLMGDAPWAEGRSELARPLVQLKRWTFYRAALAHVHATFQPDCSYLINLDEIDLALAMRGSPFGRTLPFTGILMRRNFYCSQVGMKAPPPRWRDKVLRPVYHRMVGIPSLRRMLFLEESMVIHARQTKYANWQKVHYVPDVAYLNLRDDDPFPREQLGVPDQQFVLLAYGHLTGRKAVDVLVQAFASSECPHETGLLLVGAQDEATKAALGTPEAARLRAAGRLHEKAGFASEDMEQKAFRSADAVWLGYRGWYGMSGVLVQAASVGKPLIATEEGIVGWMVERYEIGETLPAGDPDRVVDALRKLISSPELRARYAANGLQMATEHTPANFGKRICEHIEACCQTG